MSRIIHFELIETTIQMLHIALTNIYENTHNNLMVHVHACVCMCGINIKNMFFGKKIIVKFKIYNVNFLQ
jgi:hypothetical protein